MATEKCYVYTGYWITHACTLPTLNVNIQFPGRPPRSSPLVHVLHVLHVHPICMFMFIFMCIVLSSTIDGVVTQERLHR